MIAHECRWIELTAPKRYCMTTTMELVEMASLEPSRPAPDAEPTTKDPPWILQNLLDENHMDEYIAYQTSVGTPLLGVRLGGTYRTIERQSSEKAEESTPDCGQARGS